jgi:outer membrane usher protein
MSAALAETAEAAMPPAAIPVAAQSPQQVRINPTGRTIALTVPAKDGANYIGDIPVTIAPDDTIELPTRRTLQLLGLLLDPTFFNSLETSLRAKPTITLRDLEPLGISFVYDPQSIELTFQLPTERRLARSVIVSPLERERRGEVVAPADFSAYINIRGNFDYVHAGGDEGFATPLMLLDGATRLGPVVLESEAIWQPGANGVDFQRLGSRMVYDDQANLVRWTFGDLQTLSRGFQAAPDIAGISIFRSYGVLQPQRIIRPRGDRTFRLDRPSAVEVEMNGQIVRRLQLNPGVYDLRDFPFTQGANNVRLSVIDDSGRSEVLNFNLFIDQTQLGAGLSEFGVYAGVRAPLGIEGPDYSDDYIFSGYYRRGISDYLTLGINSQFDANGRQVGAEAVVGTSLGTFGGNVAVSDIDGAGTGYAGTFTFQRLIQRADGQADTLNLFFERRSRNFGPVSDFFIENPFAFEVGGGYSRSFGPQFFAGVDARFSKGRDEQRDLHTYRLNAGYRISPVANLVGDVRYERDGRGERVAAFMSLTMRFGRYTTGRADYDTQDNRARLSFQTVNGQGVGAYNVTADIDRSDVSSGFNFNGNFIGNRAELGLTHFGTFLDTFGQRTSQRTSMRVGSSLAFADGSFSVGRPIFDSFAIVAPHKSLKGTNVELEPSPFGHVANTGILGAATQPNLSSYVDRTITIDAPESASGTDLGQGSFKLFPSYRSGYKLVAGSDYSVTALGTMLDVDGEPVALVTGNAYEIGKPDRPATTVFTNRQGRFGITGLAPGKWRIEMLDAKRTVFEIEIPDNGENIVRLGEIAPVRN